MLPGFADEHVNPAVTSGLRRRGMDVSTPQDRGLRGAADERLLELATAEGRLMLTYDTDYLVLHAQWLQTGRSHAGIVFWPGNQFDIGVAIQKIFHYAATTTAHDATNWLEYLKS